MEKVDLFKRDLMMAFAIGAAWATLTFQMRGVSAQIVKIETHVQSIESFMVKDSRGKFVPTAGQP